MARTAELLWIVECEEDVASDLSVFHRIDDPDQLDGPRYFLLAERLPFYAGACQGRARMLATSAPAPVGHVVAGPSPVATRHGQPVVTINDASAAAALTQNGQGFPSVEYRG